MPVSDRHFDNWLKAQIIKIENLEGDFMKNVIEGALPVAGWNMHKDGIPARGTRIKIMHFGNSDSPIFDTAVVDHWGILPDAKDGGHGKRSTVSHWRDITA